MSNFTLTRDRDAWFVIRGYKYQVDQTIFRWLRLNEDQELILEAGEDIDVVSNALSKGPDEFDRTLEQIKHLDSPITLRSPSAKIAIANAVQHVLANPSLKLLFRFCTNAPNTTERPSPFDDRTPGIDVWEKLRTKQIAEPFRSARLKKILELLRGFEKPEKGIDLATWNAFTSFVNVSTIDDLDAFIASFEWSPQQLSANDISLEVQRVIHVSLGVSQTQSQFVYSRLFLHVMQLLTQKGLKKLARNTLGSMLTLPTLSESDVSLLKFLLKDVLLHTAQLDRLEAASRNNEQAIIELRNKLMEVAFGPIMSLNLSAAIAEISTSLPPQIRPTARRSTVIAQIMVALHGHEWFAIYGSVGCGKTQLAAKLGEHVQPIVYVSLRDLASNEANFLLHHLFLQVCHNHRTGSVTHSGLTALASGTVLILDDLPRLNSGDQLSRRIIEIADSVKPRNQRLLTLSHHPIPISIVETLKVGKFDEIVAPRLNREDVIDLFSQRNAPAEALTADAADAFLASTLGNPTLLAAKIRAMEGKEWRNFDQHRSIGISASGAIDVLSDTTFRLLSTVEDVNSRELLYRLCIVIGSFGSNEVELVSRVSPEVIRSNEAYTSLQGLWIEKQSDDHSVVCPLVEPSGSKELHVSVEQGVANVLAEAIFDKKRLSPIDFAKAVQYLKRARNGKSLGMSVFAALDSVSDLPLASKKLVLAATIADGLLDDCPMELAFIVRARQIQVTDTLGAPLTRLINAGKAILDRVTRDEMWAAVSYAMIVAPLVAKEDFSEAVRLCDFAMSNFPILMEFRNKVLEDENAVNDLDAGLTAHVESSFVWFLVHEIKTSDDFMKWFALVTTQPVERITKLFNSDMSRMGLRVALDALWMTQHIKPESNRDFRPILSAYQKAQDYFVRNHQRLFQALTVRAEIIVRAEYLNDLNSAVEAADRFLVSGENDDEIQFLINSCVGSQYLYADQLPEAIRRLKLACRLNTSNFGGMKCRALIELSRAIGDSDCEESLHFAEDAAALARCNSQDVPELDMVSALGEAALAAWFAGRRQVAFDYMDQAYLEMSRNFKETTDWKMRYALLGLSLAYMSSIASTGQPPEEDFTVPQRGRLISYNEAISEWYDSNAYGNVDLASALLVIFATATGKDDRAVVWANKGIDEARNKGILACLYRLADALIPYMLRQDNIDQALDYAYESSLAVCGSMIAHRNGRTDVRDHGDPIVLLGDKPSHDWNEVERLYSWNGILSTLVTVFTCKNSTSKLEYLSAHCRTKANDASNPAVFAAIAESIESFLRQMPGAEIHARALSETQNGNNVVASVNYLLSSFAEDTKLRHAIIQHAFVLHEFVLTFGESIIWRFIADRLVNHWVSIFEMQRFRFSNPREVASRILETSQMTSVSRLKQIIQIMMAGLEVALPRNLEATSKWLNS
jgi:hypothetical protein